MNLIFNSLLLVEGLPEAITVQETYRTGSFIKGMELALLL